MQKGDFMNERMGLINFFSLARPPFTYEFTHFEMGVTGAVFGIEVYCSLDIWESLRNRVVDRSWLRIFAKFQSLPSPYSGWGLMRIGRVD